MNKEQLQQHIKELDDKAQSIWREVEVAKNQLAALDNKEFEAILPECTFRIGGNYISISPGDKHEMVFFKRNDGYNHFEFSLGGNIDVRVDDGEIKLQYNYNDAKEILDYNLDLEKMLIYLRDVGVTKDKFENSNLDNEIAGKRKTLESLILKKLKQENLFAEIYGN